VSRAELDREMTTTATKRLKDQGWIGFGFKSKNGFGSEVTLIAGSPDGVRREVDCLLSNVYPAVAAMQFDYGWEQMGYPPLKGGSHRGKFT
jgi:hypothetical protein